MGEEKFTPSPKFLKNIKLVIIWDCENVVQEEEH